MWSHSQIGMGMRLMRVFVYVTLKPWIHINYAHSFTQSPCPPHTHTHTHPHTPHSLILHMMTEAVLMEDTLMRVLVIGLARELPLSPADALDIADKLVARAANAHTEGMGGQIHQKLSLFLLLIVMSNV